MVDLSTPRNARQLRRVLLILAALIAIQVVAGVISQVRVQRLGATADPVDCWADVSADGRYAAFTSAATDLVAGDTNGVADVFVVDQRTQQVTRVSVASDGTQANSASDSPSISADGRLIAYHSFASNLVPGDTNTCGDIFVFDRQTGHTSRVNVSGIGEQSNKESYSPAISADGRCIGFTSAATNLVPDDTNGVYDVFVYDRPHGEMRRVSTASGGAQSDGHSYAPSLNANGRYVAFYSTATNLVSGDTNAVADVYVHDRQTGGTVRASVASDGTQGDAASINPSISGDGRYVAFFSRATNLIPEILNKEAGVYVFNRQAAQTVKIVADTNEEPDNRGNAWKAISTEGYTIAFRSFVSTLAAGGVKHSGDLFVQDGEVIFQPDVLVRSTGEQAYHGEGLFAQLQEETTPLRVQFGTAAVYDVVVKNSGTLSDRFVVTGPSVRNGWSIRYFDAASGAEITGQVASAGWTTPPLGSGEGRSLRVEIVGAESGMNPGAMAEVVLTAVSHANPTCLDHIRMLTTAVGLENSPPVAGDANLRTTIDQALAITLAASDPDGDPLTYRLTSKPAYGTLTGAGPTVLYTPRAQWMGTDSFTFTANDGHADSNEATVSITVGRMNNAPVAVAKVNGHDAVTVEETDALGVTVTLDGSKSSDPDNDALTYAWDVNQDGLVDARQSVTTHTFTLGGPYTVTLTVTDTAGATATDTVTILVVDTTAPTITAPPAITAEQADRNGTAVDLGTPVVHETVDAQPTVTHDAPQVFPLGITTVIWTVTDASGNKATATQKVTIVDTTTPTVATPAEISREQTSRDGTQVELVAPTVTDICDANPSVTHNAPNVFPLGSTLVTWTATDITGNVASATQTVTIVDTTAPVLTVPAAVTAEQANRNGTAVVLGSATATDVCDAHPAVTNDAPTVFPLGTTLVTWTAVDASGNKATATQQVTIVDTAPPTITAPADVTVELTSSVGTAAALGTATATDVCDAKPTISNDAPALFPLGTTTVTWTATDASGNKATATQKVKVNDTTPPTISLSTTLQVLKSANHKLVDVGLTILAQDLSGQPLQVAISVTQDEPVSDASGDALVLRGGNGNITGLQLRDDRDNRKDGRVYLILITVTDTNGNTTRKACAVVVPRNGSGQEEASAIAQGAAAVAAGVPLPYVSTRP